MRPFIERYSSNNIIFHGHQPQRELVEFYAHCDALCAFSIQDGFSVTVPQAMACGLPVIASANVGASDLITPGENGQIVAARDVEGLKQAILELHSDTEQCAEMGKTALERVRDGYSWQDYGTRMADAYRHMLSSKQSILDDAA